MTVFACTWKNSNLRGLAFTDIAIMQLVAYLLFRVSSLILIKSIKGKRSLIVRFLVCETLFLKRSFVPLTTTYGCSSETIINLPRSLLESCIAMKSKAS